MFSGLDGQCDLRMWMRRQMQWVRLSVLCSQWFSGRDSSINFILFLHYLPEAKLLENDFYMSENLNTENNLLVPSTRRNLFKGVATGLVAGSMAGPAILSGAKRGRKQV